MAYKKIEKKILPVYFNDVASEAKTFELRKDEDGIEPGDTLILREWTGGKYTGNCVIRRVSYVLRNVPEYGLMEGYCIIGMHCPSIEETK